MRTLLRQGFALLLLASVAGCAGVTLPAVYIDTARFVDTRPTSQTPTVLQVNVQPFENRLQDRTRVGTKRVGVNEISGPLLATQDVAPVLQQSVVTQLGLKGITVGPSSLRLEGSVHDFFVDVDVDPASGRGKFRAVVRVVLAVVDTESQRPIWRETYTGTATAVASSVVDSAYEQALNVAFTNVLNQLRQDDSLLELRQLSAPSAPSTFALATPPPAAPPAALPPPSPPAALPVPSPPAPVPSAGRTDTTPPGIVFMSPAVHENSREINTIQQVMPISVLVLGTSDPGKLQVEGVAKVVEKAPASAQLLHEAGVVGPGIEFKAFVFLTPGINRVEFNLIDQQGKPRREIISIQRQVDDTPPTLQLLEPLLASALVVRTSRPRQLISGLAADEGGVAEVQVNGVTAQMTEASVQELQGAGLSGKGVKFAAYVDLQPGTNQLEVKAFDRQQNVRPQIFTVQRQETAKDKIDAKQFYTRSVGVVIGIDAYSAWPRLTYGVQGAREVQKTLKAAGFDEVIEVLDKDATRARLLQLFENELPRKVGKNDRVVIFFAGHAQTQTLSDGTQMGYIIPVDAGRQDDSSSAISMAQIRGAAKQLPAKHMFYAIDACYSGLLVQRGLSTRLVLDQGALSAASKLVAQSATQLVTAGRQGEQAVFTGGQSLFAKYLVQGLQGEADTNNDRLITATELASYLGHQVSIASDNRQTPQSGQMEGEGDVVFVY